MAKNKPLEIAFLSSETFRDIFQSSGEGIIMVDEKGVIQLANPVSESMFGYGPGDLNGLPLENLLPERYRKSHVGFRHLFNGHPEPRKMGVGRDLMAMRKNGTEFPVEISLSFSRSQGQVLTVAFISDISARKAVEEKIKQNEEQLLIYAAELEKKVHARTEALNKSVGDLEKANHDLQDEISERKRAVEEARKALEKERELNELKSRFVSMASHEFRTPLSTLLSSTSLVEQYMQKHDPEKAQKHIDRIKSNIKLLTSVLNDFLSLSKLEEGKVEVDVEALPLESFINDLAEELQVSLKNGQKIQVDLDKAPKEIHTDSKIFRNVLLNLISNAGKYSPADKPIEVHITRENGTCFIAVKDHGLGIPKEEHKHVFDRFFRASNVSNIQGTGLGLNIVRRYLDLLNGKIRFESEPGKGTVFTIELPLKE